MDPNAPETAAPHGRRTSAGAALALALAAIVGLGLWVEVRRIPAVYDAQRVLPGDPDDWMRLHRVRRVVSGERAVNRDEPLINYPRGAELHWTAPVDWLFALPAAAVWPMVRHPDAVALVCAWVPPVLGAAYLVLMFALVRALAAGGGESPGADGRAGLKRDASGEAGVGGAAAGLLAAGATAVSPAFHRAFQLGHADHQCAVELLTLLAVYLLFARRRAEAAGAAIGLAIWIAPQALAAWLAMFAGLLFAPARRAFCSAALMAVLVGHLVENAPDRLGRLHADRVSLFHVALLAAAAFAPPFRRRKDRREPRWLGEKLVRFSYAPASFAIFVGSLAAVAWAFTGAAGRTFEFMSRPEFFRWSDAIMELQPLVVRVDEGVSFATLHRLMGWAVYALPAALVFFLRARSIDPAARATLALLAVGFTALAVAQRRWIDHVNVGLAPVMVLGAVEAARRLTRGLTRSLTGRHGAAAALAVCIVTIVYFPSARAVLAQPHAGPHVQLLRTATVAEHIRRYEAAHPSGEARRAILAEEGEGPMLLDRAGLPVVAVPYHRALDGIIEAARFFSQTDAAAARAQLDRLGVRYVVVPLQPSVQLMNMEHIAFGELRSFDAPGRRLDEAGNVAYTLRFRPRVARTMVYRLAMLDPPAELGLRLLARTREGAPTADGLSGLLYVVDNGVAAGPTATMPSAGDEGPTPRNRP